MKNVITAIITAATVTCFGMGCSMVATEDEYLDYLETVENGMELQEAEYEITEYNNHQWDDHEDQDVLFEEADYLDDTAMDFEEAEWADEEDIEGGAGYEESRWGEDPGVDEETEIPEDIDADELPADPHPW